ncbi:MAG: peptidylprolyl isomerase [Euryarchaeota archaeon]|nr:peptidylprolyl isomerase [Euryarchaeota archaeon]NDB93046.1 peptidylprolyl isomerase [Euryarchaeota archaeon]NDF21988.1 peptidylprolyl isomerase [Euryarchaeota archaeon]NDF36254.1 peptidylprolyl isomerase [Euryarchaeota archaeon]NDG21117.1 peptidylprolyl isomerase [Euryarchaeota archaeon]
MPSAAVRDSVAKSKALMEDGDYVAALSTLRTSWDPKLGKGDRVLLVRTAGIVHMTWGQNDETTRRASWKESRKSLERALKMDPGNKETRRQLNALMSMMDEAGVQVGRGFSIFANGEPTPFGLLAMFLSGIILLVVIGQGREVISGFDDDDNSQIIEGDSVRLTVSYYPQLGSQKVTSEIDILLYPELAPSHVSSFVKHVSDGAYDQTIFHRIIDDFMIQGGDFENSDGTGGYAASFYGYCNGDQESNAAACSYTQYTLPDEADNGLKHEPCTISMAKTSSPNTGGSQFFLIPEDSTPSWLDGQHTVFGTIVSGCEAVTSISEVPTGSNDRPTNPVNLESAVLL